MDDKLKKIADNFYGLTSVNDFDNSRDSEVLKYKYFMLGCELIYKELSASQKASTSTSALPIADVVGSFSEGFRIDFVLNNYMRKGNAKLLIHPDDIPRK
tara:strand:- start:309 stop:608 length:300 start_codon:yes stop_codon:yes gene_type:complete